MSRLLTSLRQVFGFLNRFFPLTLFIYQFKHNLIGVLYWVLLTAIITDRFGAGFGLSFLFLSPEYDGHVGWFSFALVGFSFGGFSMAFHSYSYQRLAPFFPFLALTHKPFVRFSINNATLPVLVVLVYLMEMWQFQRFQELHSVSDCLYFASGFIAGLTLFIGLSLLYFFPINKNAFDLGRVQSDESVRSFRWKRFVKGRKLHWDLQQRSIEYWYIGSRLAIVKSRPTKHYRAGVLQSVFEQNRISTTLFEIASISSFVLLGVFGGMAVLDVPAAMSIVLLFTIILMLWSMLYSWMRFWTYPVIMLIFLLINVLSEQTTAFQFETKAYGMSYSKIKPYSVEVLKGLYADTSTHEKDFARYIQLLENWKEQTGEEKPKLIIINSSGGGLRSAAWVYEVLRTLDLKTKGESAKHIALMTGASGGMVGAAFYRSLKLHRKDLNESKYYTQITSDLLNKLSFAASTNDLFFRYQSRLHGGVYAYDRAMAFEKDLSENTDGLLDVPIAMFEKNEFEGVIPVMIFSPSIVNDGRSLLISSQPLSFMERASSDFFDNQANYQWVDLQHLFGEECANNLRFSSVLRMNATFPYVLPMTTLPTSPKTYVMDAGLRDNFGGKSSIQWMIALNDWIEKNTSGVIVLQIRDTKRVMENERTRSLSFLDRFTAPASAPIANFPMTQDFDQEQLWELVRGKVAYPIEILDFNLRSEPSDRISLSWHLTRKEREFVRNAMKRQVNARKMAYLCKRLG
jgi:hypothetical protein